MRPTILFIYLVDWNTNQLTLIKSDLKPRNRRRLSAQHFTVNRVSATSNHASSLSTSRIFRPRTDLFSSAPNLLRAWCRRGWWSMTCSSFCRALGEYHPASFVFTRLLGFLNDAQNNDDLRLKSGAGWWGGGRAGDDGFDDSTVNDATTRWGRIRANRHSMGQRPARRTN
jgi:hypothetical protein